MNGAGKSQSISDGRSQSNGGSEKNIWSSLLDSVATSKKLPEKNVVVLGPPI